MRAIAVHRHLLTIVLLLGAAGASAEISKCRDANGQIVYTQNACPPGTEPLELPVGVPREAGNSFPGADEPPERRMSLKAQALKQKYDACIVPSSAECQEFAQLAHFCEGRANWGLPECEGMNEYKAVFASRRGRRYGDSLSWEREKCRETGDPRACERVKCPTGMMLEGTDAEVRACSRFRSLPNTDTWAQISHGSTYRNGKAKWEGEFLCLEESTSKSWNGETSSMRAVIKVQDVSKAPTEAPAFRIIGKPEIDRYFQTREAAVEAACKASADWWKKAPELPKPKDEPPKDTAGSAKT
jgi:hypothetical protein